MLKTLTSRAVQAGLLALVLSGSAFAAKPPATGLGQGTDQVEDVAQLPQAHAVAVDEVLEGKIVFQSVLTVMAQLLDQRQRPAVEGRPTRRRG